MKRKLFLVLLMPLLLLSCGALWQTDVGRAVEMERKGDYAAAAPALEKAVAGGNVDPAVVESLYYSWIRQGEYAKARTQFDAWAASNANGGPIRLAAARIHHITGDYAGSLVHLNAILNRADVGVAATFEKAQVLEETGKRDEADAVYNKLIQSYLAGSIRGSSGLAFVARAMAATEHFHDANDVFRLAVQANAQNAEALVAWGDLLELKYQESEAADSYNDALAIDANMPEALLGLAHSLEQGDPEHSEEMLKKALEINPNFPEGNLFVASHEIESEQVDKALETINKVLAVNPQSAEAYSLMASIQYVQGKTEDFNKSVQKVLSINPQYSKLYYTLADSCVSLRLYKEAVVFAKEAMKLNPRDWDSLSLMGINLMRTGEEEAGRAALEEAFKGDSFNTWTGNTLKLLDSWVKFDRLETPHFQIKLDKKESAALRPYVFDLLEKAYKTLTTKYNFMPPTPVTFEMYPDHADFAVRTLGMPGLGALGVTFGQLFVMDSPSARKPDTFNWGSTLWHEFTHVITLEMTDHKIPRWLSEGISVSEERQAFPGWGDDMKLEYLVSIKEKKFLPVAGLNDGFIHPTSSDQVLLSYYQASIIVDYIEGKWGFPALRNMLLLYKAGKDTPDVFKEALNVSLEGFDTEFNKWVDGRTAAIDPAAFKKFVEDGHDAMDKNDPDKAITALTAAIAMYPEYSDDHNPYEPLAQAYLKKGNKAAAIDTLQKFLSYNETSFDSYVLLAKLLEEKGDNAGAARWLEGAMYVRPMDPSGHEKLGTLLLGLKQYPGAAREYETLLALNTPDQAGAYFHLAEAFYGEGKEQDARTNVRKALEIAPSYEPAQELLLKIVRK